LCSRSNSSTVKRKRNSPMRKWIRCSARGSTILIWLWTNASNTSSRASELICFGLFILLFICRCPTPWTYISQTKYGKSFITWSFPSFFDVPGKQGLEIWRVKWHLFHQWLTNAFGRVSSGLITVS
jgi:hypothetical protein